MALAGISGKYTMFPGKLSALARPAFSSMAACLVVIAIETRGITM